MANGDILRELRQIVSEDRQITTRTTSRLVMAALAELLENRENDKAELAETFKSLKADINCFAINPSIRFGKFITSHPKIMAIFSIAIFVVLIVPHLTEAYIWGKALVEMWLGLPGGLIP